MQSRDKLANLYVGALDLWVIRVLAPRIAGRQLTRPCRVVIGRREKTGHDGFHLAHEFWIRRADHARLLLEHVRETAAAADAFKDGGWFDFDSAELVEMIRRCAAGIGVPIQNLDKVQAEAHAIAANLDRKIEGMRQSGGLKEVNQAYKAYRLNQQAAGEKAVPYRVWLERFAERMVEVLADEATAANQNHVAE